MLWAEIRFDGLNGFDEAVKLGLERKSWQPVVVVHVEELVELGLEPFQLHHFVVPTSGVLLHAVLGAAMAQ